jgi:hypothetical protein
MAPRLQQPARGLRSDDESAEQCDLSDPSGASVRAPDVVVVGDVEKPRDDFYRGTPLLAVEVRGTQSKRYLEEKVKLYLEHAWPSTWVVHAEREEVEVWRPGTGSVVYRRGGAVPLVPELDRHDLEALPVAALFDEAEARRYNDEWVQAKERARSVLAVLEARGIAVSESLGARVLATNDTEVLAKWLALAMTAPSAEALVAAMG